MAYITVQYLNKKEISNNEIELQVSDLDRDIQVDVNGKTKNLIEGLNNLSYDLDYSEIPRDKLLELAKEEGFDLDDLDIDEDEIISDYFCNKSLEDIIDDHDYENTDIKEYINNQLKNGKSILDFVDLDESVLIEQLTKFGHHVVL